MEVKYPHVVEGHAVNALAVVTTQPSYYPSPAQINDPSLERIKRKARRWFTSGSNKVRGGHP